MKSETEQNNAMAPNTHLDNKDALGTSLPNKDGVFGETCKCR